MANHAKPIPSPAPKQEPPPPEPPRIEWGQIQRVGDKFHLVRIVTQGNKIIEQHIGDGYGWRPVIEAEFQRWAVDHVLDREDAA